MSSSEVEARGRTRVRARGGRDRRGGAGSSPRCGGRRRRRRGGSASRRKVCGSRSRSRRPRGNIVKHRQQLALCRAIAMRFDDAPNGIRRAHDRCFIQVGHALQLQVTHTPTPNLLSKPPRDETRVDAIADSTVARTSVPSRDDVHFHPANPRPRCRRRRLSGKTTSRRRVTGERGGRVRLRSPSRTRRDTPDTTCVRPTIAGWRAPGTPRGNTRTVTARRILPVGNVLARWDTPHP